MSKAWLHRFGLALLALGHALLLPATALKETPLFWRSEGGFPLWLRQVIGTLYYPGLLVVTSFQVGLSYVIFARLVRHQRGCGNTLAILIFWGSLGLLFAILVANNLTNYLEGKPIHAHD